MNEIERLALAERRGWLEARNTILRALKQMREDWDHIDSAAQFADALRERIDGMPVHCDDWAKRKKQKP